MSNSVKTDNIINVLNILLNCDIHADERYFWEVSGSPFVFLYTHSTLELENSSRLGLYAHVRTE